MDFKKFIQQCSQLGIQLTDYQVNQFTKYLDELLVWNEKFNLTAIRDTQDIVIKHFLDSFTIIQAIPKNAKNIIDIGTGAGFPGIPLKIVLPHLSLTLIDSSAKKVTFLQHVISVLNLENTIALQERAETLGQQPLYREFFDIVVNRAVATLPVLAEYSLPLLKIGGTWISQKSSDSESVETAQNAITTLGGKIVKSIPINIVELPNRQLIIVEKKSLTPKEYPRTSGKPSKKPL